MFSCLEIVIAKPLLQFNQLCLLFKAFAFFYECLTPDENCWSFNRSVLSSWIADWKRKKATILRNLIYLRFVPMIQRCFGWEGTLKKCLCECGMMLGWPNHSLPRSRSLTTQRAAARETNQTSNKSVSHCPQYYVSSKCLSNFSVLTCRLMVGMTVFLFVLAVYSCF
jgi:hypothetical protein